MLTFFFFMHKMYGERVGKLERKAFLNGDMDLFIIIDANLNDPNRKCKPEQVIMLSENLY